MHNMSLIFMLIIKIKLDDITYKTCYECIIIV